RAIRSDLLRVSLMYFPDDRLEYLSEYRTNRNLGGLFGEKVKRKFRNAEEDIKQAGNCYAIEDHDGCVFHLVRVLEHGLSKMSKRRQVPCAMGKGTLDLQTWGTVINQVEISIKSIKPARNA